MEEQWLPVLGYEGLYSVSSEGRVKSLRSGRLLTAKSKGSSGYLMVSLSRDGFAKMFLIHRLVAFSFLGEPAPGQEVCHENGDRTDPRLANLRWDSRSENAKDRARHGTHFQALKVSCPMGHNLSGQNLARKVGGRKCRACANARSFARYRGQPLTQELADQYYERYSS